MRVIVCPDQISTSSSIWISRIQGLTLIEKNFEIARSYRSYRRSISIYTEKCPIQSRRKSLRGYKKLRNQYEWKNQWYWFSTLTHQCRHLYRVRWVSIRWRAFDCHAPYLLICPHLDQMDVVPMFSGNDVYTERNTYLNVNFTWSTDSVLTMISLVWDLRSAVRFS